MNKTDVTQILKNYTKLQERVLEVSRELYDSNIDQEQYEVYADKIVDIDNIIFEDNNVSVYQTTYGWGGSTNYLSTYFPIEWLNLSEDELLEQARIKKQEKDRIEAQKKEEQIRLENEKKEQKERELYEKLKVKFEPATTTVYYNDDDEPFDHLDDANYLAENFYPDNIIVATKEGNILCETCRCNAWQPSGEYHYFLHPKNK